MACIFTFVAIGSPANSAANLDAKSSAADIAGGGTGFRGAAADSTAGAAGFGSAIDFGGATRFSALFTGKGVGSAGLAAIGRGGSSMLPTTSTSSISGLFN